MWVKYLKNDKTGGFNKNEVVFISDGDKVSKDYKKGISIPVLGPDGKVDIHSAPPEDQIGLWENMDRSKEEKNKDKLDSKLYKDKTDR